MGVNEPQATFSPCFGGPRSSSGIRTSTPTCSQKKSVSTTANVWLVNTGWSGGPHGVGKRMKLAYTRAIIDAIHDGSLAQQATNRHPVFGVEMPQACAGLPTEVLDPRTTWASGDDYDQTAQRLAVLFQENFKKFEQGASSEIRAAGPTVRASV
jgi:phosphoenolpyruvate carboxykinase (ATP)